MILNKTILIGMGIVIGIYLLYKLLFVRSKFDEEYHQLYNKILTSEEYKVKGQYDKQDLALFLKFHKKINKFIKYKQKILKKWQNALIAEKN